MLFVFAAISAIAGIVVVFEFFGIKPLAGYPGMSATMVFGIVFILASIGSSAWGFFRISTLATAKERLAADNRNLGQRLGASAGSNTNNEMRAGIAEGRVRELEAKLESFKKLDRLEKTPHGLRLYASNLAGSLFSILVELDKPLETSPAPMTESQIGQMFADDEPIDAKITTRAADRNIPALLDEAILCARDLGVISEPSSWVTSINNVQDVRSRISDMKSLSRLSVNRRG